MPGSNEKGTDIIIRRQGQPLTNNLDQMIQLASQLISSGFLPTYITKPAQAVAVILAGREVGIPEMQALRQIHIIQGKPTIAPELMLAMAYRDIPGFHHRIVESTDAVCKIEFSATGRDTHVEEFTFAQATKMGLTSKDNWKKMPKTMLQWRCTSAGLRIFAPDAVCGMAYTPEEMGANVDDEGRVVEEKRNFTAKELDERRWAKEKEEDLAKGEIPLDAEEAHDLDPGEEPPPTKYDEGFLEDAARQSRWTPANAKFLEVMKKVKKTVGDAKYYEVLGSYGFSHADEVLDRETQKKIFKEITVGWLPESWTPVPTGGADDV